MSDQELEMKSEDVNVEETNDATEAAQPEKDVTTGKFIEFRRADLRKLLQAAS